ncbi:hypothetical protein CRUP_032966, partial [Coryphaenoides rupestris]
MASRRIPLLVVDGFRGAGLEPFSTSRLCWLGPPPHPCADQSTYDTKGKTALDCAYRYNPRFDRWLQIASLNAKRTFFHLSGITRDTFQKQLWSYDPAADAWTRCGNMMELRGLHCMCTVGARLYVMGGNHFGSSADYDDVLSCKFYSPAADQWTAVAAMPRGQSDVGVTVFRGRVYVVGGYSWNSRCMVDIVQRYDPEQD